MNLAIIGFGFSGKRFLKCLVHLKEKFNLNIVGIVDRDIKLVSEVTENYKFYQSITDLLQEQTVDVVVISTNDNTHELIFDVLKDYPSIGVICEKPLIGDFRKINDYNDYFENIKLTVNYVERMSPIIDLCVEKVSEFRIKIGKVIFNWGKDRFYDSRDTLGVLADITHPIDLVLFLLKLKNVILSVDSQSKYVYTLRGTELLDSVSIRLQTPDIVIAGNSSFLWESRRRSICLYGHDHQTGCFQIKLIFDNPLWDSDSIEIVRFDELTKTKQVIFNENLSAEKLNTQLPQLNKVYSFLEQSLDYIVADSKNAVCKYEDAKLNINLLQKIYDEVTK